MTVIEIHGSQVTLSTGEVVIAKFQKLRDLCEQLAQEQCAVRMRTWWTPDGTELIEIHRATAPPPMGDRQDCEAF